MDSSPSQLVRCQTLEKKSFNLCEPVFSSVKWDNKDHHLLPRNTEKAKFEAKTLGWGKKDAATVLTGKALIGVSDSGKGRSSLQAGCLHTSEFPRLEMLPSLHLF